jgi:hypothetical protein
VHHRLDRELDLVQLLAPLRQALARFDDLGRELRQFCFFFFLLDSRELLFGQFWLLVRFGFGLCLCCCFFGFRGFFFRFFFLVEFLLSCGGEFSFWGWFSRGRR